MAISLITPSLTREQLDAPSVSRLSQLHLTPAALTTGRPYRDQAGLEPLIWQASTGLLPRAQDTPARSKPRRSRLEVLAGIQAATEARTRARLAHVENEITEITAEPLDEPQR